ncbi:MAG: GPR endopeptidase [Clostridia bacterium]|nr:GPR endopeptidase [Clostridia bacterium]
MFDLIDECGKELKEYGYSVRAAGRYGISVASLKIETKKQSENLGLKQGQYYIINSPLLHSLGEENEKYLSNIIANKLKLILKGMGIEKQDKILLACLGNFDVEGDRLGKEVFDRVNISTLQADVRVYKFCPNVFIFTGIESAEVVKILVKHLKIKCVIIIDSLTTVALARLGTSFQLSSSGMTPGSGVNRFGRAIDAKDLNAVCVSIGVPFMISSSSLGGQKVGETILVPKDVSQDIARAGRVIAGAINKVVL